MAIYSQGKFLATDGALLLRVPFEQMAEDQKLVLIEHGRGVEWNRIDRSADFGSTCVMFGDKNRM